MQNPKLPRLHLAAGAHVAKHNTTKNPIQRIPNQQLPAKPPAQPSKLHDVSICQAAMDAAHQLQHLALPLASRLNCKLWRGPHPDTAFIMLGNMNCTTKSSHTTHTLDPASVQCLWVNDTSATTSPDCLDGKLLRQRPSQKPTCPQPHHTHGTHIGNDTTQHNICMNDQTPHHLR